MVSLRSPYRPFMESLETRDCPAAPWLSLAAAPAGSSMVTLSGFVQDEAPGGLLVTFAGAWVGAATTDANGAFSLTVTPSASGTVTAHTMDQEMLGSNFASADLNNAIPMIVGFAAECLQGRTWRFSGVVRDEAPAGLIVQFGGLPSLVGKTAVVQADGSFSLVVELAEGETGAATASVTDWWNQFSSLIWDAVV